MILRRLGGGDEVYNLKVTRYTYVEEADNDADKNSALICNWIYLLDIRVLGGIKMNKKNERFEICFGKTNRKNESFIWLNARRTKNLAGKMFKQIADEEKENYEVLKKLHDKWEEKKKWPETIPLKVRNLWPVVY